MAMTRAHPDNQLLKEFAAGSLDSVVAALLSAHVSSCPDCSNALRVEEACLADTLLEEDDSVKDLSPALGEQDFVTLLNQITSSEPQPIEPSRQSVEIRVQGELIKLPAVLSVFVDLAGHWQSVVGNLWQKAVSGHGAPYQIDFIYMEAGGKIPQHTHRGREYTLVLQGSFSDELGDYGVGDLVVRDGVDEHTPYSDEGCLCLAVIDAPLYFTAGLARLLNPFSRFFFKSEAI